MIRRLFIYAVIAVTALYTPLLYAGNRCFINNHHVQQFRVVEQFDVIQKRVEFDADYFLGDDGYYDVQEELKFKRDLQERRQLQQEREHLQQQQRDVAEMYREMLLYLKELRKDQPAEPHVDPMPDPDPKPVDPPVHTNPKEGEPSVLDTMAYRIFTNKCGSCHTEEKAKGGLVLFGEGYLNNLSLDERVLVFDHTAGIDLQSRGKKLMPLGGPALPDDDVELLRLWMVEEAERVNKLAGNVLER